VPDIQTDRRLRRQRRGGLRRAVMLTLVILGGYGLLAYLVLPDSGRITSISPGSPPCRW